MAILDEILDSHSNEEELDESFLQAIRALPLGLKIELSLIGVTLLSGFIRNTIKRYRSRGDNEFKVYSFNIGNVDAENLDKVFDLLKYITKTFKNNSEVIDSIYKIRERNGNIYVAIINILIHGYNKRKYDLLIKNPALSNIFDFESAEVESGTVYDSTSKEMKDQPKQISEGLVHLLWPALKAAAIIYTGKVLYDKISDMIEKSNAEYGKYVTYGWEFDSSETSLAKVEKFFNEVSSEIEYFDRQDVIKDIQKNVFRNQDKIVVYLMISVGSSRDIFSARKVLDKVSKKYDIEFSEIKRGSI